MRILGLCQGANLEIFEEFCNLISSGKIKKARIEKSIDKIELLKSNYGIGKK